MQPSFYYLHGRSISDGPEPERTSTVHTRLVEGLLHLHQSGVLTLQHIFTTGLMRLPLYRLAVEAGWSDCGHLHRGAQEALY